MKILLSILFLFSGLQALAKGPEVEPKFKDTVVRVFTHEGRGSAFNYRGFLITAGHVCGMNKSMLVIQKSTDLPAGTSVVYLDLDMDICVLLPIKRMPRDLAYTPVYSKQATAIGYGGSSTEPSEIQLTDLEIYKFTAAFLTRQYSGLAVPGMSGGPVLNDHGDLIGLISTWDPNSYETGVSRLDYLPHIIDMINKAMGKQNLN